MTRVGIALIAALVLNVMLVIAAIQHVGAADALNTAEPTEMVWYSGIVRREAKEVPWHFVADKTPGETGHTLVGLASVTCDWRTGVLHVRAPFTAVAGAVTQVDETFAKREIIPGPSIANDDMRIFMYRRGVLVSCSSPLSWGSAANLWVSMYVTP